MKWTRWAVLPALAALAVTAGSFGSFGSAEDGIPPPPPKTWALKANILEATTDGVLCPSYDGAFASPDHRCRFIAAYQVIEGRVGDVKLDGVKFVLAGDLGRDLSKMELSTLAVIWDDSVSEDQKRAIEGLIGRIYPVKWTRKVYSSAQVVREDRADGGSTVRAGTYGTLTLDPVKDEKGEPVVKRDPAYWNAARNDGFRMMSGSFAFKHDALEFGSPEGAGFASRIEAEGVIQDRN